MKIDISKAISPLDHADSSPYYRQIYGRFRDAIANGLLKPGERIPSARALTRELGLARGTIEAAYALLTAEGYIEARGQAGTIVTPGLKAQKALIPPVSALQPIANMSSAFRPDSILPFQMGLPALDAFPRKIWARLTARCARSMQPYDMVHPPVMGIQGLREAIAAYLHVSRGISCSPSQVFITSGYRQTIELIAHTVLKAGDRVWVEDPGYPPTREMLKNMQIAAVPVPVDAEGLMVSSGIASAPRARAVVVTPAHQSPLCVSLSLSRRLALLGWAVQNSSWIIEDDYDGEYRYASRPLPALKSLDSHGRVFYAGTFSKVIFPGLRIAYMVAPETQVERLEQITQIFSAGTPALMQEILKTFLIEGHFARHIQRMRKLYGIRREAATRGLNRVLGKYMEIDSPPGGMHLILRFKYRRSDRRLVARMLEEGIYAEALTDWTVCKTNDSALLLGFTNVASEHAAEILAGRILKLL